MTTLRNLTRRCTECITSVISDAALPSQGHSGKSRSRNFFLLCLQAYGLAFCD